jgi:hypothetical protein
MTDKVLLANGELIERTYFLNDLKVGDKLYGVQDLKGFHYSGSVLDRFKIVEVTIQKIGRKYADFTVSNFRDTKKMLLENGKYISDWVTSNLIFFKELEEAAAYIKNQEMIKNAEDTIQKLYNKRLDIELALRIQNAFPEY